MIAVVDYGVGNLFSLKSSLASIGAEAVVTGDEKVIRSADKMLLPGECSPCSSTNLGANPESSAICSTNSLS